MDHIELVLMQIMQRLGHHLYGFPYVILVNHYQVHQFGALIFHSYDYLL